MLGLNSSLCYWLLVFLTNRVQPVKSKTSSSSPIIFSTGAPRGAVPSLLLFTLLTRDCSAKHQSCHIVKFAEVVGCIISNDECDCRQEVERLESRCRDKSLCINVKKTKEMILDFKRSKNSPPPLHIGGAAIKVVSIFKHLGVHSLTRSHSTSSLRWHTSAFTFSGGFMHHNSVLLETYLAFHFFLKNILILFYILSTKYLFTSYNYISRNNNKKTFNLCTAWLCYDRSLAIFYNISGALTG